MASDMMEEAQEFQEAMRIVKDEIVRIKVTGESGGGMVQVAMQGPYTVNNVSIDSSLLQDKKMLEDLIAAALNDGIAKINSASQSRIAQLTAGIMPFPGMKISV